MLMEEIRFDIRHHDDRKETIAIRADRATIGSGAHCDVRLPPDQAAFEHVVLTVCPEGVRAENTTPTRAATLDGAPFTIAPIGASACLRIGTTQVQITRAAIAQAPSRGKLGAGKLARLAVLGGLAVGIYFAATQETDGDVAAPAMLPELFPATTAVCPRKDPSEARVVADDQRAIADGARERSPFEPREAIAGVAAYETAAACYRITRADIAANEATANAKELRDATLLELRARRVRLERMLAVNDLEIARQDVAVLRALTEGQRGPWVMWLAQVHRQIRSQSSSPENK